MTLLEKFEAMKALKAMIATTNFKISLTSDYINTKLYPKSLREGKAGSSPNLRIISFNIYYLMQHGQTLTTMTTELMRHAKG